MRQDSRLARVLHVLLHLDEMEKPATSVLIARMLGTNSAVVRRTMAGLRRAGYVQSIKGHGGGWSLAQPLEKITLLGIYEALGSPQLFAIGCDGETSTCKLAREANNATSNALSDAQQHFYQSLSKVTVADLIKTNSLT
jgi:Rrf2 family protein